MSKQSRERSRAAAAYLKERGIERTTGQCPMGCGRPIKNGGQDLMIHLTRCKGRPKMIGGKRR